MLRKDDSQQRKGLPKFIHHMKSHERNMRHLYHAPGFTQSAGVGFLIVLIFTFGNIIFLERRHVYVELPQAAPY